jgi:hypothetical protein
MPVETGIAIAAEMKAGMAAAMSTGRAPGQSRTVLQGTPIERRFGCHSSMGVLLLRAIKTTVDLPEINSKGISLRLRVSYNTAAITGIFPS